MMKEIYWRDKKLYRVAARDYGDLIHRSFGVIVNSIAQGMAFAVVVVVIFLNPRLLNDLGRDRYVSSCHWFWCAPSTRASRIVRCTFSKSRFELIV